jgi:GTP-binding protein EngB required for normal cell division
VNEKRKPTYQEIIKLCNKKDKEIEILKTKWDKLKKWANEPKVYICHYHILDKMNEI